MINNIDISGLIGLAGAGKTTMVKAAVAELDGQVVIMSLATPVKELCSAICEEVIDKSKVYIIPRNKIVLYCQDFLTTEFPHIDQEYLNIEEIVEALNLPDYVTLAGRELLQLVGTDIFRSGYENIWVDLLKRNISNLPRDTVIKGIVIDDIRFMNETLICDQLGFVYRPCVQPLGHKSEALAAYMHEAVSGGNYNLLPDDVTVFINGGDDISEVTILEH